MTDDFNIKDCLQDCQFLFHSSYKDTIFDIADSFQLEISNPTKYFPTRYSDNDHDSNLVLELVFLQLDSAEINTHHIHPDWKLSFDYVSRFIIESKNSIKNLKTDYIININSLEEIVNSFAIFVNSSWQKNSKKVNITRYSKV